MFISMISRLFSSWKLHININTLLLIALLCLTVEHGNHVVVETIKSDTSQTSAELHQCVLCQQGVDDNQPKAVIVSLSFRSFFSEHLPLYITLNSREYFHTPPSRGPPTSLKLS